MGFSLEGDLAFVFLLHSTSEEVKQLILLSQVHPRTDLARIRLCIFLHRLS